jgi:hypothetical protein
VEKSCQRDVSNTRALFAKGSLTFPLKGSQEEPLPDGGGQLSTPTGQRAQIEDSIFSHPLAALEWHMLQTLREGFLCAFAFAVAVRAVCAFAAAVAFTCPFTALLRFGAIGEDSARRNACETMLRSLQKVP